MLAIRSRDMQREVKEASDPDAYMTPVCWAGLHVWGGTHRYGGPGGAADLQRRFARCDGRRQGRRIPTEPFAVAAQLCHVLAANSRARFRL